jgi:uncharacterized protein (DUF305 family)
MNHKLTFVAALVVLAAAAIHAQPQEAPPASAIVRQSTMATAQFAASTDKEFGQLMDEAMSVMHRGMHNAPQTGDPDRDFVTMMIPHHQGAIDMAKALLLYGKDPQMRRLAQEIITDQQSEIELMQLWLKQRDVLTSKPESASHHE